MYMGVGGYANTEHDNAFIQGGIDMLLELLTLTWSRISSDVKRELDTEQKLISLLREHNINSLDHHTNAADGDRFGLGAHSSSLTHPPHLLRHSLTHSITHSLTHSLTYSLTYSLLYQVIVMQVEKTAS